MITVASHLEKLKRLDLSTPEISVEQAQLLTLEMLLSSKLVGLSQKWLRYGMTCMWKGRCQC